MKVLITGGGGFIGSHLADGLLTEGHEIRVLDALVPQVHGDDGGPPDYLSDEIEFIRGDVRDAEAVAASLADIDAVFHQAAAVGVGQSMYEVVAYCETNVVGTATVLEEVVKRRDQIQKVVVASSMSNYGEGRYKTAAGHLREPDLRRTAQFEAGEWELVDESTGERLLPAPTDEAKAMQPTSVYATTKRDQEELVLNVGRAYDVPSVALRYFNVYGTRQALSNPYTGVAAIFSGRLLIGEAPLVFEDGLQSRDFTHVSDIVQANILALEGSGADGLVLNVGTGIPTTLLKLTELLMAELGVLGEIEPQVVGKFREGDIRHCYADISLIRERLGFTPGVKVEDGIPDLVAWVREQTATDRLAGALEELQRRALVR
jgi:dTDP-L-rhamnose 4-epimerase